MIPLCRNQKSYVVFHSIQSEALYTNILAFSKISTKILNVEWTLSI